LLRNPIDWTPPAFRLAGGNQLQPIPVPPGPQAGAGNPGATAIPGMTAAFPQASVQPNLAPPTISQGDLAALTANNMALAATGQTTPAMQDCPPVTARILQGNAATIGKIGGFPGRAVSAQGAAVIPDQWGGKAVLAPNLGGISGQFHGANGQSVSFDGVSDVIGGKSPIPDMNVRAALQQIESRKPCH
jgi:hypothetical protein